MGSHCETWLESGTPRSGAMRGGDSELRAMAKALE